MTEWACRKCGSSARCGVQYQGTTEDWDGVSEWICEGCGVRFGRWTGRELGDAEGDAEIEARYGAPRSYSVLSAPKGPR